MPALSNFGKARAAKYAAVRKYFRHGTSLQRWQLLLTLIVVFASLSWLIVMAGSEEHRNTCCTHGQLNRVHAAWEDRCDACHTPQTSTTLSVGNLFDAHERWNQYRCDTCHAGTASDPKLYNPHHENVRDPSGESARCASCHRDHRGPDASLVRLENNDCTRCHAELSNFYRDPTQATVASSIKSFTAESKGSHPEFRLLDQPPEKQHQRHQKFSQSLHMTMGLPHSKKALGDINGNTLFKVRDIDNPQLRDLYRPLGGDDDSVVQLSCASCHQTGGDQTSPKSGSYMLPINYESHCQACHPTKVPSFVGGNAALAAEINVPHRLQTNELERYLKAEITRALTLDNPKWLELPADSRNRVDQPREPNGTLTLQREITNRVERSKAMLFATVPENTHAGGNSCGKCHDLKEKQIVPTNIPTVWFTKARFNHSSHRAMNCLECHQGKEAQVFGPQQKTYEKEKESVHIAGIDNCQKCHSPKTSSGQGGVRSNCTDCHRYHGYGTVDKYQRAERLLLNEFMQGSRTKP
jgi:predicted CXXCH cytochrome family protein